MTSSARPWEPGDEAVEPRERIVRTAYELFCRDGIQRTGVDRIVSEAGVAKASLYRNFRSKDNLVLAVLERRETVWTRDWLEGEVEARATDGGDRLLAIFDVFGEWFRRSDYEGCLLVNTLLEAGGSSSTVRDACVARLANARSLVGRWAQEAGVSDPNGFAGRWQLLMMGSIIAAAAGDTAADQPARQIGALMLERERHDNGDPAVDPGTVA